MTSREIVRRTLDFENPPRVARTFEFAGIPGDTVWAGHSVKGRRTDWREIGGGRWEMTDLWGNTWSRVDPTSKGEATAGIFDPAPSASADSAVASMSAFESYQWPDFSNPADFEPARRVRAEYPDKWVIGGLPGFPFSIARTMQRLDVYLMNLLAEPEFIARVHDRIESLLADMIRNYGKAGADAVMFGEDWGTQRGLFINPALFEREFLPRYQRLCAVAHESGVRVFMHSCGQIEPIVPWLIDAGVDLFQFDQPELHGLDVLASHQKRAKATFMCPVDIQKVLQTRDEKLIRAKAREMLDKLWQGRGGFIADCYGDNASIGLKPEVQSWACDEFVKLGVARRYRAK